MFKYLRKKGLSTFLGPVFDDLQDLPYKGAFALGRAGRKHVLEQAIARAFLAARGAVLINRSCVKIPERSGGYREGILAGVVEQEKAQPQRLEVDLVADDRERRILQKRRARGPGDTAHGARFKNVGTFHCEMAFIRGLGKFRFTYLKSG